MGSLIDRSEVLLELGLQDSSTSREDAIVDRAIQRAIGAVRNFLRYDPIQATRTEYYPTMDSRAFGERAMYDIQGNQAHLETYAGDSLNELQLRHLPIRRITELYIDYDGRFGAGSGKFGAGTLKTEGEDFYPAYDQHDSSGNKVCNDGILHSQANWPVEAGTVKVVYVAGYSDEELRGQDSVIDVSPIHFAAFAEAVRRSIAGFTVHGKSTRGFKPGPILSERAGDYSVTFDSTTAQRLYSSSTELTGESREQLQPYVNYGIMLE